MSPLDRTNSSEDSFSIQDRQTKGPLKEYFEEYGFFSRAGEENNEEHEQQEVVVTRENGKCLTCELLEQSSHLCSEKSFIGDHVTTTVAFDDNQIERLYRLHMLLFHNLSI